MNKPNNKRRKESQEKIEKVFLNLIHAKEIKNNTNDYLKLFKHIKDNQIFYKTYFKLGRDKHFVITEYDTNLAKKFYDDKYIDYHIEFFMTGLNAIVKKWLDGGCKESPEEIDKILKDEYKDKQKAS